MNNQLARTDGNISELSDIAGKMREYIKSEDEGVLRSIVETTNKSRSLIDRLFPSAFDEEHKQITLDRMRTIYAKKKQYFELYTEVQLEIARKQGDALVASVGMDLQAKVATFATQKILELNGTVGESRERFLERMLPQLTNLDKYKATPILYDPAYKSIQDQIKIYFDAIDQLLRGFNDALSSKLAPPQK